MPDLRPRVGSAEAGPLVAALRDASPDCRLAALDALTRLPLDTDCWLAVRRYVAWAIGDPAAPEHLGVIPLAARVPIASVRGALRVMAGSQNPDERREAAFALGAVRDSAAVEALVDLLDEPGADAESARLLARNDVSAHVEALRSRAGSLAPIPRFWVALALARAGDDAELRRFVQELGSGAFAFELLWGDPSVLLVELRAGAPLAETAVAHLHEAAAAGGDSARLADLIAEASVVWPLPAPPPAVTAPAPPAVTDALRERMRAELADFQLSSEWRERVGAAIDAVAAESNRRTATALAVSELFAAAASGQFDPLFGNELGPLTLEVDGFAPDLPGLLEAYRPLATGSGSGVGAQIGWTAGRGGLPFLLVGLASALADHATRLVAARLISAAAPYLESAQPPVFGGGTGPPEPAVEEELIDDLSSANGGGEEHRRGLETPAEPRWILASVTDVEHPEAPLETAFRSGGAHEIAVAIGPPQAGMLAARGEEPFDRALGETTGTVQLFVTFIPPPAVAAPQTGSLFLPPAGTSRPCTFAVQLPEGLTSFDAQIQVYHENRMVQLALLKGPVVPDPAQAPPGSRIELELAVLRPGGAELAERERFDAAIARTSAATTAVADERLALFDNDRIDRAVPTLARILGSLATSDASRRKDLEDPGVVDDLRALAFQGCELHEAIAAPLAKQLGERSLDRLQVLVESACDFFPVEFVYELPPPERDAGLCPGWKEGLRTGRCPEAHEAKPPRGLADHVCPTGFWAVSKVIERQVVGEESWQKLGLAGAEFAVRPHPTAERRSLEPPKVILFGATTKVDDARKGRIATVRTALERIADRALYADTWDGWVEAVRRHEPTLLVLLSHSAEEQFQAALEVGAGDLCLISQVEETYVRGSPERNPIVLLLGCETAVTDVGLQTFVARFQDVGAALVVGTVASVVGERAAPVARTLAQGLASAAKGRRAVSAGDVLLGLRRKLLASGELTALCLTAFGDADWELGGS